MRPAGRPKNGKGHCKKRRNRNCYPGVSLNDKLLENKSNNFLASVYLNEQENGIAFLDISTGEFFVAQGSLEYMDKLLQSFQPSEVLIAKGKQRLFREQLDQKYYMFALEDWIFQHHYGYETLMRHFDTQSLKGYGIEDWKEATVAAGAALHYLKDTEHPNIQHINTVQRITATDFLWMDRFTIRNLELMQSPVENGYTLLRAMDHTITPMGARMLKRWIIFPLNDIEKIEQRLDCVTTFIREQNLAEAYRTNLRQIGDLERLAAKIPLKKINPREVILLGKSLQHCAAVKQLAAADTNNEKTALQLSGLTASINPCQEIQDAISNTLNEEAPVALHKGGAIKEGVNDDLDQLRKIAYHGKEYLLRIQQEESQRTGIPSLKVAFNNVFGYYLEVTNTHKDKVPPEWIRKQTLTSAERYITPELKEYEEKILGAEEKISALEQQIYDALIEKLQTALTPMQGNAQAIARIDCLLSFAHISKLYKYCRPQMSDKQVLEISQGRHPVIEQLLPPGETYIANDLHLDKEEQQVIILTGPNMSGKSALLRQTALITLMAHVGCYVPATSATVGLTDKIFTRVGASDNLSGGESTFMVEMNETASIINNLSSRSLIILDEIGRGTSTYDGISIAWSIVEHIHNHIHKPKTLFATHYHELNELEHKLPRTKNFHITHKETGNKVIFLRKLERGGSRHSFGIQVARMAGMPPSLTDRANEILAVLEEKHADNAPAERIKKMPVQNFQLNIFDGLGDDLRSIQTKLYAVDINTLTPVEALMKLNELKDIVKSYQQ
jgi:DNA mismatch repair protein MutS